MFNRIMGIFDYRHSFYEFMRKLLWVFFANVLFIVTSIPIFTIGASLTAMYSVVFKLVQEREFKLVRDYFASFIRNFSKATVIWIVCLILGAICYLDISFFWAMTKTVGVVGYILFAVAIIITIVFLLCVTPIFPILAEFEGSVKDTLDVMKFVVKRHLKQCIWAVISSVLVLGFAVFIIMNALFIFIYFPFISIGLNAFIIAYIFDSVLRPYYEEDEELEEYNG